MLCDDGLMEAPVHPGFNPTLDGTAAWYRCIGSGMSFKDAMNTQRVSPEHVLTASMLMLRLLTFKLNYLWSAQISAKGCAFAVCPRASRPPAARACQLPANTPACGTDACC